MAKVGGAKITSVKFIDNSPEALRAYEEAVEAGLTAIGLDAEGWAKREISGELGAPKRVDTGNLRNSITNDVDTKEHAVYIGTNVEYGIYVHEGTYRMEPNRFLRNAAEKHLGEYKQILEDALK